MKTTTKAIGGVPVKKVLDRMVQFITERHLETEGGYPLGYDWVGDVLVVADLDGFKERNATIVKLFTKPKLLRWYKRADMYLRECGRPDSYWPDDTPGRFGEWDEALWETEQD